MANTEDMQASIMQVAIQAATAAVRAEREADLPAEPHATKSCSEETHRPR